MENPEPGSCPQDEPYCDNCQATKCDNCQAKQEANAPLWTLDVAMDSEPSYPDGEPCSVQNAVSLQICARCASRMNDWLGLVLTQEVPSSDRPPPLPLAEDENELAERQAERE